MRAGIQLHRNRLASTRTEKVLSNHPRRAPLSFTTYRKKLAGHVEGVFLAKSNDLLTLETSQLKGKIYWFGLRRVNLNLVQ